LAIVPNQFQVAAERRLSGAGMMRTYMEHLPKKVKRKLARAPRRHAHAIWSKRQPGISENLPGDTYHVPVLFMRR
jgi:hypothetical protein